MRRLGQGEDLPSCLRLHALQHIHPDLDDIGHDSSHRAARVVHHNLPMFVYPRINLRPAFLPDDHPALIALVIPEQDAIDRQLAGVLGEQQQAEQDGRYPRNEHQPPG